MEFKITNVKVSVKSSPICLDSVVSFLKEEKIGHKVFCNYIVIHQKFTYVIFKQSNKTGKVNNHINITKIPDLLKIEEAKDILQTILKNEFYYSTIIDNITVSSKLDKQLTPQEIIDIFKDKCRITFNQETFPGVFLKFNTGTVIIFHTGRCILIGCKNTEDIVALLTFVKSHI
jgi:hypothetical protein